MRRLTTNDEGAGIAAQNVISLLLSFPLSFTLRQKPMAEGSNVDLWLPFNDLPKLALSIPVAECKKYAVKPLKWLRFLAYAIYGREGYLSRWDSGQEINDYMGDIEASSYYFVPQGAPCLVDIDAMEARTSVATDVTIRRANFKDRVRQRDGSCVVTGEPVGKCHACHLLPHSKGDEYIVNLMDSRGGAASLSDLNTIDDPRNGLLLCFGLHDSIRFCESAFLKTPNFALSVEDICTGHEREAGEAIPQSHLTLHHFVDEAILGGMLNSFAPNDSDARQSQDADWPPSLIFDYIYGVVVLRTWGPKVFLDYVREQTSSLDPNNIEAEAETHDNHALGGGPVHNDVPEGSTSSPLVPHPYYIRSVNRASHCTGHPKDNRISEVMDVVTALWMSSASKGKTGAVDSTRDEVVKTWLQSVEETKMQETIANRSRLHKLSMQWRCDV